MLSLRVQWRHQGQPGVAALRGLCVRFIAILALFYATFPLATRWKGRVCDGRWADSRGTFLISNFCGRQLMGLI